MNDRKITYKDRLLIELFLKQNKSIIFISKHLGIHRTSVFREIKRVCGKCDYIMYNADIAQKSAKARGLSYKKRILLEKYLRTNMPVIKISDKLNVSRQAIYDELNKTSCYPYTSYNADLSQKY